MGVSSRQGLRHANQDELEIAVINTPFLSNYDDVLPFERETGVIVRFVDDHRDVLRADLAILGGSKSVLADLSWLKTRGIDQAIMRRSISKLPTLGICGGCQMLGKIIDDTQGIESSSPCKQQGLGLLELNTTYQTDKQTKQVAAELIEDSFLGPIGTQTSGYYIHSGRTNSAHPLLKLSDGTSHDGAIHSYFVVGTMIHGLFESKELRKATLKRLRQNNPYLSQANVDAEQPLDVFDQLADVVRQSLDLAQVYKIIGL